MTSSIQRPVTHGRGYKVIWGIASLGTSLIAGIYGALLPIFYQDYLGLISPLDCAGFHYLCSLECDQ